ncbi:MAG TPA: AI-2E family transporter [Acidimicrobiales bacterium]|jgi:predicted PurR-regulated permease PerM|nr:AI-2E family transporter [Acidimicrobiales bacterium]
MADDVPDTWRSRLTGNASRRGVPLATIVTAVAVTIGLIDLNVALIVGLWVLRKIVLYTVVAFFLAVVLTPLTRLLSRRAHMSHAIAATVVFLGGLIVLAGLVYLFASPLVTSAVHFGHQVPDLIKNARKGRGPLGKLVYRLHLQKYLSEGSTQISKQLAKVLKPATAFSVGAAAVSSLISIATIAVLTFFTMMEAPRLWYGFLGFFKPATSVRLSRVINESIRSVTGYMLGNFMTSIIAGVVVFINLEVLSVPFAVLLGVFVALVDLLPLVGGLLAGLPTVIIAAIHSVPAGIITLVVFLIYQQVENHILNPVIMSRTVRLNPLWVLMAVLIGATLGGKIGSDLGSFVGALIGIPVGGAIQVVAREIRRGPGPVLPDSVPDSV